jgi:hypothetical protein
MVVSSRPLMKEKLYRRLERLEEERLPAGPPHILDVVFVKPDVTRAPRGIQVIIPPCGSGHDYRRGAARRRTSSRNRLR